MHIEIPDWLKYELIERWRKYRDMINNNPKAVKVIALVSVFVLMVVIIAMLGGESRPEVKPLKKIWFYDLNTGELFKADADEKGPVKAPSGPGLDGGKAGVKAHVFTYVNKPAKDDLIIGYLEKPDPNASDAELSDGQMSIGSIRDFGKGFLVRTIADPNWFPADSSRGKWIVTQATKRDKSGRIAKYSTP